MLERQLRAACLQLLHAGRYVDTEGKAGTYEIAAGSMNVTFHDGALDGQRAVYQPGKPPTVVILVPSGNAVGDCQLTP